jgi:FAD-dependent urate hydroxylase
MGRVAVIGSSVAGASVSLLLSRVGYHVECFELLTESQLSRESGAGLLLQPSGLSILHTISPSLLRDVIKEGTQVNRLYGETAKGRTVLDLQWRDLHPTFYGLGVQRWKLFAALRRALLSQV